MQHRPVDARTAGPLEANVSLLRYAVLLTGNRADAEDLVQEALAHWFAGTRSTNSEIEFANSYVRKTLTNAFLNGRRRQKTWRRLVPVLAAPRSEIGHEDRAVLHDQLSRALRKLSAQQRAAVVLRFYEDLSFDDIAVLMGCPAATARSLVSRGLRRLRIIIDDEETS